jgi:hypothetical protein
MVCKSSFLRIVSAVAATATGAAVSLMPGAVVGSAAAAQQLVPWTVPPSSDLRGGVPCCSNFSGDEQFQCLDANPPGGGPGCGQTIWKCKFTGLFRDYLCDAHASQPCLNNPDCVSATQSTCSQVLCH